QEFQVAPCFATGEGGGEAGLRVRRGARLDQIAPDEGALLAAYDFAELARETDDSVLRVALPEETHEWRIREPGSKIQRHVVRAHGGRVRIRWRRRDIWRRHRVFDLGQRLRCSGHGCFVGDIRM